MTIVAETAHRGERELAPNVAGGGPSLASLGGESLTFTAGRRQNVCLSGKPIYLARLYCLMISVLRLEAFGTILLSSSWPRVTDEAKVT